MLPVLLLLIFLASASQEEVNPNGGTQPNTEIKINIGQQVPQLEVVDQPFLVRPDDPGFKGQLEGEAETIRKSASTAREWIAEQEKQVEQFENQHKKIVQESFVFYLDPEAQTIFRWSPSTKKELTAEIYVNFISESGQVQFPGGSKDHSLEISTKASVMQDWSFPSIVYRHKWIQFNHISDYLLIRFYNKYSEGLAVEVRLQRPATQIEEGVKDVNFADEKKVMDEIFSLLKTTEHRNAKQFQFEKARLDKEFVYHASFLGITAFELLTILIASAVQLVCIKDLLDFRVIV